MLTLNAHISPVSVTTARIRVSAPAAGQSRFSQFIAVLLQALGAVHA